MKIPSNHSVVYKLGKKYLILIAMISFLLTLISLNITGISGNSQTLIMAAEQMCPSENDLQKSARREMATDPYFSSCLKATVLKDEAVGAVLDRCLDTMDEPLSDARRRIVEASSLFRCGPDGFAPIGASYQF